MASRAELVNEALEASVPLQYPEDVVESMRLGPYLNSLHRLYAYQGCYTSPYRYATQLRKPLYFLLISLLQTGCHDVLPSLQRKARASAAATLDCKLIIGPLPALRPLRYTLAANTS